jgi:hypothetical protein
VIRQANILDPIHDSLPSDVWDTPEADAPRLKPQHRKWITTTVVSALKAHGYTHVEQWLSLVLTGSLTTYQYGPESDCDLSLFVDAEHFPEWSRAEMIGVMVSSVDGTKLPGTTYPLQCFVVDTKVLSKADLYKPGLRSGYDLATDTWIEPPDRSRAHDVAKEDAALYAYGMECADKMERLLRYEPDKAVDYWHQLHRKRRKDQLAGKGDYAPSNVVYKFLEKRGLFKEISEASGEYIAKIALQQHRQVSKFVYDPIDNRILIGRMAAEEGEAETHPQLMQAGSFDRSHGLLFGQIDPNGWTEVFNRPQITGYGKGPINQYEADWRLQRALDTAVPGARIHNLSDAENPRWVEQWTTPEVDYMGDQPIINATSEPAPAENTWDFTGA